MSTLKDLWPKLARTKKYREEFVAVHAKQAIPFQIRALMKQLGLSQKELARRSGLTQGVVSRAADPSYGNLTINTLVRIAAGFDVAFVGRFVPFSDLPPWFDRLYEGEGFYVETFAEEDARRRALAQAADGVAVAEFATIPETSQTVIGIPLPDFNTPQVLNTPSMERIEQVRHPNEQLERIRDSVPVTVLKSELPVRAQESVKEIAHA